MIPQAVLYFFGFFCCVLASAPVKRQILPDYIIDSIDIPPGGTIVAGTDFVSSVNATISGSYNDSIQVHPGSYELMAGANDSTNSAVVDLMFWNEPTSLLVVVYFFPANLLPGSYHFRVNITNDVSSLSGTFQVTAPVFDCLTPPPWKKITSTSDPNYRSFVLERPQAGVVTPLGFNLEGSIGVSWNYKDYRNLLYANLNNIQFDFVNVNTGQSTGLYIVGPENYESANIPFAGSKLTPGPWRIRANYTNPFEGVNGAIVTYLSEVVYFSGGGSKCDGIGTPNSSAGRFQSSSSGWKLAMGLTGFVLLVWSV